MERKLAMGFISVTVTDSPSFYISYKGWYYSRAAALRADLEYLYEDYLDEEGMDKLFHLVNYYQLGQITEEDGMKLMKEFIWPLFGDMQRIAQEKREEGLAESFQARAEFEETELYKKLKGMKCKELMPKSEQLIAEFELFLDELGPK